MSEDQEAISILLASADPIWQRGWRDLCRDHPTWRICAMARSGPETRAGVVKHRPRLVAIDHELPGGDVKAVIRDMAALWEKAEVILFGPPENLPFLLQMLKAGVRCYLQRNDSEKEVLAALDYACKNRLYVSAGMYQPLLGSISGRNRARWKMSVQPLSQMEAEVLELFARGQTPGEIAVERGRKLKTVESQLASVRRKWAVGSGEELRREAARWLIEREEKPAK